MADTKSSVKKNIEKVKELQNILDDCHGLYHCPVSLSLPADDPVRVSNHPAGERFAHGMYERNNILQLRRQANCPRTSIELDLTKPLVPCRKELVFYAVVVLECFENMPLELKKIADSKEFNLNEELNEALEVLTQEANTEHVKVARDVLKKLQTQGENAVSEQEMDLWYVKDLKKIWSFDYGVKKQDEVKKKDEVKKSNQLQKQDEVKVQAEFKKDEELLHSYRDYLENLANGYNKACNNGSAAGGEQQFKPSNEEHDLNRIQRIAQETKRKAEPEARDREEQAKDSDTELKRQQEEAGDSENEFDAFDVLREQENKLRKDPEQSERERKEGNDKEQGERNEREVPDVFDSQLRIYQDIKQKQEANAKRAAEAAARRAVEAARQAEDARVAREIAARREAEAAAKRAADEAAVAAAAQAAPIPQGNATKTRRV